jgi:4-oxalocrotonate tautomerase
MYLAGFQFKLAGVYTIHDVNDIRYCRQDQHTKERTRKGFNPSITIYSESIGFQVNRFKNRCLQIILALIDYDFLINLVFDSLLIFNMPIITVAMYSGRTQRDKDRLAEAITEDVVNIPKVEKKDVIMVFQEASHGNWYASGVRL